MMIEILVCFIADRIASSFSLARRLALDFLFVTDFHSFGESLEEGVDPLLFAMVVTEFVRISYVA
jgi:hypothetical protein